MSATADFTAIADRTVTFRPSELSQQVQVMIIDDNILENPEEFMGLLSLPVDSEGVALGSANMATATILDDDSKAILNNASTIEP